MRWKEVIRQSCVGSEKRARTTDSPLLSPLSPFPLVPFDRPFLSSQFFFFPVRVACFPESNYVRRPNAQMCSSGFFFSPFFFFFLPFFSTPAQLALLPSFFFAIEGARIKSQERSQWVGGSRFLFSLFLSPPFFRLLYEDSLVLVFPGFFFSRTWVCRVEENRLSGLFFFLLFSPPYPPPRPPHFSPNGNPQRVKKFSMTKNLSIPSLFFLSLPSPRFDIRDVSSCFPPSFL